MEVLILTDVPWRVYPVASLLLIGLVFVCRGLSGGLRGDRGLVRRRVAMSRRIEDFQLVIFGLMLAGLGAAWIWEARWLFYLAIGIGFVELRESSLILAAWRRSGRTRPA
jgi:hypothetical protein